MIGATLRAPERLRATRSATCRIGWSHGREATRTDPVRPRRLDLRVVRRPRPRCGGAGGVARGVRRPLGYLPDPLEAVGGDTASGRVRGRDGIDGRRAARASCCSGSASGGSSRAGAQLVTLRRKPSHAPELFTPWTPRSTGTAREAPVGDAARRHRDAASQRVRRQLPDPAAFELVGDTPVFVALGTLRPAGGPGRGEGRWLRRWRVRYRPAASAGSW